MMSKPYTQIYLMMRASKLSKTISKSDVNKMKPLIAAFLTLILTLNNF